MPSRKYKKIVDEIVGKINDGTYPPGFKLPTHRAIAANYKVALVTASRVYVELEGMGLVSGETGRGTFVRETSLSLSHGIDQPTNKEGLIDLNFNSSTLPNQTQLLRDSLRKLSFSGDLETLLHYQPHAGRKHERAIISRHLRRSNIETTPEQILIVSGAQHGLACTAIGLFKPGDVIVTDALTYPGFKVLAQIYRLELIPLPLKSNGPDLEALETICQNRSVRAIYTMPTMHNPLGWVLDIEQRKRIVLIAQMHDLIIIEDAAYAFLAEKPPTPLTTLSPNNSIYISGISKSIATGLRVGYIAAPIKWVAKIERTIRATTWNTPSLMTAIACQWIEDNTIIQLENEKREDAKRRQHIVKKVFQDLTYIAHPNAYFIWLPMPDEIRADKIVMTLLQKNIAVTNAEPFCVDDSSPHALRIALGSVDYCTLEKALIEIRDMIKLNTY